MSMVVQHNMQAANANRMLGVTTGAQAKSTEKLSSGYKINRAADDAAGLSISEKMRKQIRGLDRASSNAEDGVSAVQTAEGALTEVHSMLQRMNELAVQASNGTNADSDRKSIQDEMDQLTTEIDRVAETTKFNETYLLKGDNGTKTINMNAHDAGLKGDLVTSGNTATFTMKELSAGDSVSIGGKNYTIGSTKAEADALLVAGTDANKKSYTIDGKEYKVGATGIFASDGTTQLKKGDLDGSADTNNATLDDLKALVKAGSTVSDGTTTLTVMTDAKKADGTAGADGVDDNNKSVISKEHAYELAANELLAANKIGDTNGTAAVTNADNVFTITLGSADVANTLSFGLHVGSDADMTNKIQVDIETMNSQYLGIKGINVNDESGIAGTYAIDAISDAISKVSSQRSALGAVQNRLEHTISNLDNVSENTSSAESRIRDTDMAEEMVNYSKNNILAQAGQSMLAQANQSNQGVLSLLQ